MPPIENHVIHLENGKLANDTPRRVVDDIARQAARHSGDGGITVHFHGGLVDYRSGMEIAERLLPPYQEQGRAYPVFFVWESGLLEILRNNLRDIADEAIFQRIWKRVEGIVRRKFRQRSDDRAANVLPQVDPTPIEEAIDRALRQQDAAPLEATETEPPEDLTELSDPEIQSLEAELLLDAVLIEETQRVANALRDPAEVEADMATRDATVRGSTRTLMDPVAIDELVDRPDPGARGFISTTNMVKAVVLVAARVIKRFVRQRHHGFHATIVEEILRSLYVANAGGRVWSLMKNDTADAFKAGGDVYGGTAFLEALAEALEGQPAPRITLTGHSTGAIYISEFLDRAVDHLPAETRYGIVFLAPASTFETTAATLLRHRDRIDGFRMFTMSDTNERRDRLVPVLYPYSLLYFVSGILEDRVDMPLVGMDRFFDAAAFQDAEFPGVAAVRRFIEELSVGVVWSVTDTGDPGKLTASLKHGDFDNDLLTLSSIAHILAEGF